MTNDFLEIGERGALLCDDGPLVDSLTETLESMGFKCHTAPTPEDAIEKMAYTNYDLISITEDLAGSTLETNGVLRHLTLLPMAQRRNCYSLLIGNSFRTLDAIQAYAHSVHLVVNQGDLGTVGPILRKGLADFERLYATYQNILKETGELSHDRRRK